MAIDLLGLRNIMNPVAKVWGGKVESHGERRSIQSDREGEEEDRKG